MALGKQGIKCVKQILRTLWLWCKRNDMSRCTNRPFCQNVRGSQASVISGSYKRRQNIHKIANYVVFGFINLLMDLLIQLKADREAAATAATSRLIEILCLIPPVSVEPFLFPLPTNNM